MSTCGAIFGPDGDIRIIATSEEDAWNHLLGRPTMAEIKLYKSAGYRFALVTVTEQSTGPSPPPPGTRFDEEGVPMEGKT